jgi:uracil-DNA glycosylase family 4
LREHSIQIATVKRRAYRDWEYWGKPVPGFGDPAARLLILGLAPGAHGSNRTGRMFTGDESGNWLYRAMHRTGFATQPTSVSRDDGLELRDAYITAAARCAPPDNKPTPDELRNCRPYLEREIALLPHVKVVLTLGKIAFDTYLAILKSRGTIETRASFVFGHDLEYSIGPDEPVLLASYHPSQQNTSTGKLTEKMLLDVFRHARKIIDRGGRKRRSAGPKP